VVLKKLSLASANIADCLDGLPWFD